MMLGIVTGTVVATEKHADLAARKLLLVQPADPAWKPVGKPLVAVDAAQAGPGDRVLVVDEGGSARFALAAPGRPEPTTIRAVIVGIVDAVDRGREDGR